MFLHGFHLRPQEFHGVFARRARSVLLSAFRFSRAQARCEHADGVFEHLHVRARLLFNQRKRIGRPHGFGPPLLTFGEAVHAHFQPGREQGLRATPIKADQLAQEIYWQRAFALVLFLKNDLCQHLPRQVISGLGVDDFEINLLANQVGEMIECDIG